MHTHFSLGKTKTTLARRHHAGFVLPEFKGHLIQNVFILFSDRGVIQEHTCTEWRQCVIQQRQKLYWQGQ